MLRYHNSPQSEVIRAILLEDGPCYGVPAPQRDKLLVPGGLQPAELRGLPPVVLDDLHRTAGTHQPRSL